jgi:hypothetical protein
VEVPGIDGSQSLAPEHPLAGLGWTATPEVVRSVRSLPYSTDAYAGHGASCSGY